MCGRYIIKSKIEIIEQRFELLPSKVVDFKPNFNVSLGDKVPVIASNNPNKLQFFRFGLQPFWSVKPMYLFNARAEGDKNKQNSMTYSGAKEIAMKPAFRKPIRSQRCIVPADAFIEGTTSEKLNKPFVVFMQNNQLNPFAFAGIWDTWLSKDTGELIESFAIITTTSNSLLQRIPHHRSPVILQSREEEALWLDEKTSLSDVLALLRPYPGKKMNAYPISNAIKSPTNKSKDLLKPIGDFLQTHSSIQVDRSIDKSGFGRRKKSP